MTTKREHVETPKELANRLKREYQKQWRMKNPDKVKNNADNFWLRRAAELIELQKEDIKE